MKRRAAAVIAMLLTIVLLFGVPAGAAEITGAVSASDAPTTASEEPTVAPTTASTTAEEPTVAPTTASTITTAKTGVIGSTVRLSGADRCETALKVSASGWDSADCVVVASGISFADALSGVPLAYALDAPVILSVGSSLDSRAVAEIQRLGATKAYILGGTAAVPASVEKQLSEYCNVKRISGENRFETSSNIARELMQLRGAPAQMFIASGLNYPDALAGGTTAALLGAPILFVPIDGTLDLSTHQYLTDSGCLSAFALGGTAALPESELAALRGAGVVNVSRISGSDRFQTALRVYERFSYLYSGDGAALATGTAFPDALAGGVLCAKRKIPLFLISNDMTISGLYGAVSGRSPTNVYVLGGTGAVSEYAVSCLVGNTQMTTTTRKTTTTTKTTQATKPSQPVQNTGKVKITAEYCHVRTGAGTGNPSVGKVYRNASYKLFGSRKASNGVEWYEIEFNGKHGFICSAYAEVTESVAPLGNNAYVLNPDYSNKYYIVVYLKSQSVVVYGKGADGKFNKEANKLICSTGLNDTPTPQGTFKLLRKYRWQLMKGDVYTQYCSAFADNYLFHSVLHEKPDPSTLFPNSYRNLGGKASHGCIRLCTRDCKWIYDNCPIGTQVRIVDAKGPAGKSIPSLKSGSKYSGWDPSDPSSKNPYNK